MWSAGGRPCSSSTRCCVGLIGLVVFAALRYRSYTGVPVDACSLLRKTADNPICLKVGSRVFLWHAGAAKTAVIVTLFFGLLDNVVLQSITGSTVGKMCFRLSVVDENGAQTHPLRMLGRWVFLVVDVGFCLVGCFMTLATHPHRRIGDFVFGTYVVAMRSVGRPVVVAPGVDRRCRPGPGCRRTGRRLRSPRPRPRLQRARRWAPRHS